MNLLKLSWKNLTNKPLTLFLNLVLFALGIGLISLLFLLSKQMEEKFDKNLAGIDLVIGAKGSPLQMILCAMYQIDAPTGNIKVGEAKKFMNPKHPLIKNAVPLSLGDSYKGYRIVGTTAGYPELYNGKIAQGKMWQQDFEVTIGAGIAADLNMKMGDLFNSSHGFVIDDNLIHDHDQKFKVVGIFAPTGSVLDQVILTTPSTVWAVHDHEGHDHDHGHDDAGGEHDTHAHDAEHDGHDHDAHDHGDHDHDDSHDHDAHAHDDHDHDHAHDHAHDDHGHEDHDHAHHTEVQVDPNAWLTQNEKEITNLLVQYRNKKDWRSLNMPRQIDESTDLKTANPAYQINRLFSMMGVGMDLLKYLAGIIVFVSGLSIFISLYNSLKARKYELALMRVMGGSRSKLFSLIILEGLILAVLGYILGMLLSHVGMNLFAGYMKSSYRYSFTGNVFYIEEFYLLIGALVIGFIAAFIPALQASKTPISTTLSN